MIHGRNREAVLRHIEKLIERFGLQDVPHQILFSRRRFKQRGARYRDDKANSALAGAGSAGGS
jgi:hypothetical protein